MQDLEGAVATDVKLESIEFKSDRIHQLFSVQCRLTNGVESPEFIAEGLESENYGNVVFTGNSKPIRQL